jgi:hypothetical protein
MNLHVKTLLTLAVLTVLLFIGISWGWSSLTRPFPHKGAQQDCYRTELQAGDRVSPPKVMVSVFNASDRVGLAERTLAAFQDQGFGTGDVGNAPKSARVRYAQIWADDPTNPAVRLVASRLGHHVKVVAKKHSGAGVIVMVGAQFKKLVQGKQSTKVTAATTICSPPTG